MGSAGSGGTYYCNAMFYDLLTELKRTDNLLQNAVFVHTPELATAALNDAANAFSMCVVNDIVQDISGQKQKASN